VIPRATCPEKVRLQLRWILSACGVALTACPDELGTATRDAGVILAVVGDDVITADDFQRHLAEQPEFVRVRYATLDRKKEFLDGLIRQELLLHEAKQRKLEQDPEVQALLEKVLVQRLVQQRTSNIEPTEAEARAFYEAHQADFVRPERVRVAHHFVGAARSDARREAIRADALKVAARLKTLAEPALSLAFREEVRKGSADVASRSIDGDLGLRTRDELQQLWGPQVAAAADALKLVGEVSPLVESEKGFHLLQLMGRQPALNTTFDEARPRITQRLQSELRGKALEQLVDDLKKSVKVEIQEDALRKLQITGATGPLIPPADGG